METASSQGPIPVERTRAPYDLPDALGDLTSTISALDTAKLSSALTTLANTFKDTPPDLKAALEGVAQFSSTLDNRDAKLRSLLTNANKVVGVLGKRSDQIANLVINANALLAELLTQRNAVDALMTNVGAATRRDLGRHRRQPDAAQARPGQAQLCAVDLGRPQKGTAAHLVPHPEVRDVVR